MEPQIHYGNSEPRFWVGKSTKELYDEMEKLRIAVKNASGYTWDNSQFFIDDGCGHVALTVLFMEKEISFWNEKTGSTMGSFVGVFSQEDYDRVREWIRNIEDDLVKCNECDAWVKKEKGHFYSWAGFVCNKCYDPKVHVGPDTRGD